MFAGFLWLYISLMLQGQTGWGGRVGEHQRNTSSYLHEHMRPGEASHTNTNIHIAHTSPRRTSGCSCAGSTRRCAQLAAKSEELAIERRGERASSQGSSRCEVGRSQDRKWAGVRAHRGVVWVCGGQGGSCLCSQLVQL